MKIISKDFHKMMKSSRIQNVVRKFIKDKKKKEDKVVQARTN